MFKIKLIIADPDSRYVDKVTEYIQSSYHSRIKVSSYTKIDLLDDFLQSLDEPIDILLIHLNFLVNNPQLYKNIQLVVQLSEGSIIDQLGDSIELYKYQTGEKLVNQLLNIYSEKNGKVANLVTGFSNTKLVSVYSPTGGAGKTSVTLGLAANLSEAGKKVFCLSLETLNSISSVLTRSENDALSHILLSLNEDADKLPLKFELYKTKDRCYNFDFFEPAECFMELSEMTKESMTKLLIGFKQLSNYDVVLIDMDSKADDKALAVFEQSDKIAYVQVPDSLCHIKTNILFSQLNKTGMAAKINFFAKLIPVVNKYNGEPVISLEDYGLKNDYVVPVLNNFWLFEDGKINFDINYTFSKYLAGLAKACS